MASASRSSHHATRGTATPLRSLSTDNVAANTQAQNGTSFRQNGEWIEPPMRAPAPSFQDNPGITRQGVLETMMPLGTLPTTKVRARVKEGDPLRKVVQARNLDGLIVDEERATPEAGIVSDSTRAGALRTDTRSRRGSPAIDAGVKREGLASPPLQSDFPSNDDWLPGRGQLGQAEATTSPHHSPRKRLRQETPTSRAVGNFTHSPVPANSPYFTAVALGNRNGSPEVQTPLAFLYATAEADPELSRLLQASVTDGSIYDPESLLSRKIKQVKKLFRSQNSSPRSRAASITRGKGFAAVEASHSDTTHTSVSPSAAPTTIGPATRNASIHSPHKKNASALKIKLNVNPSSSANTTPPTTNSTFEMSKKHPPSPLSPPKESVEKPTALSRRSSSTSSLSSANSEVLKEPPPTLAMPPAKNKRPAEEVEPEDPEVEKARKRLKRNAPKPPPVKESNIRQPPAAAKTAKTAAKKEAPVPATPKRSLRSKTPAAKGNAPPENLADDQQVKATEQQVNGEATQAKGKRSREEDAEPPEPPTALGRPPKKQKTGPRTKTSPVKNKKKTVAAGVARPESRRRPSPSVAPTNNTAYTDDSDWSTHPNADWCASCGENGYLLCCDGCERSFHFCCADPPLDPDGIHDSTWYCFPCNARHNPPPKHPRGLFSALLDNLDRSNPTAFQLPAEIRNYYKNVQTGEDGDYVEEPQTRPLPAALKDDQGPNFKALKDSKGNAILCHQCGKSSGGTRDIATCDYCGLHWHLDCLDPPLANPPGRKLADGTLRRWAWKCPAHVDHTLKLIDPLDARAYRREADRERQGGDRPSHRLREPKVQTKVRPHLRRGMRNNGIIEIESESSDESGFESEEEEEDGTIVKLPRKGIKLDFIAKVHRDRELRVQQLREENAALERSRISLQLENERRLSRDIDARQLRERQAAFNLTQFKTDNADLNIRDDELANLVATLEAEATPEVNNLIENEQAANAIGDGGRNGSRGLPSPASSSVAENSKEPTARQREFLRRMHKHIGSILRDEPTEDV